MKWGILTIIFLAGFLSACSGTTPQQDACDLQALDNAATAAATASGNTAIAADGSAASVGLGIMCNDGVPIATTPAPAAPTS